MATQPVLSWGLGIPGGAAYPSLVPGFTDHRCSLRVQDCPSEQMPGDWLSPKPGTSLPPSRRRAPVLLSTLVRSPLAFQTHAWGPSPPLKPLPRERAQTTVGSRPVAMWWPCGGWVPGGAGGRGGCDHFAGTGCLEGRSEVSAEFSRWPDSPGGKTSREPGPALPPPCPASGVWDVGLHLLPVLSLPAFTRMLVVPCKITHFAHPEGLGKHCMKVRNGIGDEDVQFENLQILQVCFSKSTSVERRAHSCLWCKSRSSSPKSR